MSNESKVPVDHSGSSLDSFLEEEGILDDVELAAIKRVIGWKLLDLMNGDHPDSESLKSKKPL